MIEEIIKLVEKAYLGKNNIHGESAWQYHIVPVVRYAKLLAEKFNADQEVVEIAAWLHDYASVLDKQYVEDHHIYGAQFAEKILKNLNYSKAEIESIRHCILSHRGSKKIKQESLEAKIVASADALAHIMNFPSIIYYAFVIKSMNIDQGWEWAIAKIERSWSKLMPEAREIADGQYKAIKLIFNEMRGTK